MKHRVFLFQNSLPLVRNTLTLEPTNKRFSRSRSSLQYLCFVTRPKFTGVNCWNNFSVAYNMAWTNMQSNRLVRKRIWTAVLEVKSQWYCTTLSYSSSVSLLLCLELGGFSCGIIIPSIPCHCNCMQTAEVMYTALFQQSAFHNPLAIFYIVSNALGWVECYFSLTDAVNTLSEVYLWVEELSESVCIALVRYATPMLGHPLPHHSPIPLSDHLTAIWMKPNSSPLLNVVKAQSKKER